MLFVLKEVLDLFVQNTDLRDVFLVQSAHLLEHLRGELRALLVVVLVLEFQHVLQLVYAGLFLLDLTFQLKQGGMVLILSF
jgi:hypothetical protein